MIEIRDNKTKEIVEGRGYSSSFKDVQAINHELQDDDATYALFKTVREKDPKLAGQLYFYLEACWYRKASINGASAIWATRRGDSTRSGRGWTWNAQPKAHGGDAAKNRATNGDIDQQRGVTNSWAPPDTSAMMKKSGEDRFVGQTRQLIEILVGTGHKADAERSAIRP